MRSVLTLRALIRSQHGPEVLLSVASIAVVLLLLGLQTAPSLDHGHALHLVTLGPGVVAAVTSVATSNKLADLTLPVDPRLAVFRGLWCPAVVGACCLMTWPVAVSLQHHEIVGATGLLVALTFAVSTLVGSAAWCVGAANTALAIALPRRFPDADPITALMRSAGHLGGWEIGATVVAASVLYAGLGGQGRSRLRGAS